MSSTDICTAKESPAESPTGEKEDLSADRHRMNTDTQYTELISRAGDIIRSGGLVAFPTETVYGLGGDALNPEAARRIYQAKGRPSDNPLIVHICEIKALSRLTDRIPDSALTLAEQFWPGPLTMIFEASDIVPGATTGGLRTVAVRMPDNDMALDFIRAAGGYVAAPSANTSGRPSPTRADHVREDLGDRIDMILDGGAAACGLESTILDMTGEAPLILRPGFITAEDVEAVIGVKVDYDPAITGTVGSGDAAAAPKAPGMKYRHYAPRGDMYLVEGEADAVRGFIIKMSRQAMEAGKKAGILCTLESAEAYRAAGLSCIAPGSCSDMKAVAADLYDALRSFDTEETDVIYSECFPENGLGIAVMNRLKKAAGGRTLRCG